MLTVMKGQIYTLKSKKQIFLADSVVFYEIVSFYCFKLFNSYVKR